MNKFICTARTTHDWEMRVTSNGKGVAKNSLAINDGFGENKQTIFLNVTCFGKLAESVDRYGYKGQLVLVEGRIQTGSYENKEGRKINTVDVIADKIEYLSWQGDKPAVKEEDPMKGFEALDDVPF